MKFFARADGASVFLTQNEAVIAWSSSSAKASRAAQKSENTLRLQFVGATGKAAISGENELPGKTNYLLGNDPHQWHTNVPHFSAVSYREIYPGVDARFYGGSLGLEYDLAVSPSSDYRGIILRAADAGQLRLDSRGNLLVGAGDREILMRRPVIFQLHGNHRIPVEGGYRLLSDNSFGFRVGAHRNDLPLIIDPSISVTYTSFLGGNGAEKGNSVAVDSSGAVYVGGTTTDVSTFPDTATCNDVQSTACAGTTASGKAAASSYLFAAKIDTTKSGAASLVYLTFIGGSGDDEGGKVAVDNSTSPPSLAILGWTTSTDFPTLPTATAPSGLINLTVSKLNGTGNAFVFSEYYGGNGSEATQGTGAIVANSTGGGIATDSAGDVFVTSDTTSTNLTTTTNAVSSAFGGGTTDGFLAEFASTTGALSYATYFGINATVGSSGVAMDSSGDAYVVGFTSGALPTTYPLATNSFQSTYSGGAFDAFIIQINPSLLGPLGVVYASLLGGNNSDQAFSVALDSQSPPSAYITGSTSSTDFVPASLQTNSFQPCFGSTSAAPCPASAATSNAFFAVVSQTATTFVPSLAYASYLGGTKSDSGQAVAVVSTSNVLVAGKATSSDFPIFCPSQNFTGTQDAFLASFNPTATGSASLIVSSLLGGSKTAEANAVAADTSGNAILFGDTGSSDYPLGANPNPNNGFQPTCTSCALGSPQTDAFLTKTAVSTAASGCISFNPASANLGTFPVGSTNAPPVSGVVTNAGNASVTFAGLTVVGANAADFPLQAGTTCTASTVLAPSANCGFIIGFTPTIAGTETATLQITDTGANSPLQNLDITGTGTAPEVSLSPNTGLTFGSVPQGTTSAAQVVTVNNTGNASLTINSITIDPTVGAPNGPTSFGLPATTNACSTASPIPAGGSCNIAVNFTPTATGALLGQVDVADNANNTSGGATQTIALSGTGTTPTPIVGLSPTSLTFGSQNLGTTSTPQTITVTNSGSATLNFANIQLTGLNASQFQIVTAGTTCQVGVPVAASNGTCTIEVDFAPNAAASANAAVTLTDDATPGTQSVPLTGTGMGAIASYTANTMSFGGVSVGVTSSPQMVTLTNNGNVALTISNVAIDPSVGIPADFTVLTTSGTPCQTVGSLAPSGSCTITVSFSPSVQGTITGQVDITDNASPATQTISLDGTGLQFGVSLSSNSMAFGSVSVGATSSPSNVTLTNTGNQPLTVSSVTFDSAVGTPSDFAFTGTNDCVASSPLAANATCTITVSFTPAAQGAVTGQVDIADNGPGSPQTISLGGTGTQPVASFSPPSFAFGSVNVGVPSSPQTVTLTNTGNQTLTISSVTLDPSVGTPADFALSGSSTCLTVGSLAPSASCTITVTFTPSTQGSESGQIDVADNAAGTPQLIPMNGTGTAAGVSLNPSSVPFGNQSVGTTSAAQQVTLTNTGNINLVISALSFTGANTTDFQIDSNQTTCAIGGNGVSSNGGTCIIAVDFAPQASGSLSASVSITDNAAGSPQSIALSGTGTQPNVQFSPTAMNFGSVNTGSTSAPITVTLTNTGNQPLTISSVTIDSTVGTPTDFAFTTTAGSNTCATVSSLAVNGTCTITVTFAPSALGSITGQVDVADDAPGSPQLIPMSGTGTAPGVSLNPSTLTFPSTSVGGSPSAAQSVTLTNTGTSSLSIFSITTTGANPGDFQIVSGQTTCPSSGSLGANSSCIIAVDFAPTASGSRFGFVSISDNAAGTPQTVALSGTGTQPAVTLSSNSLSFGNVNVGTTATQPTITLTNTGNQSLLISSVRINPGVGTPGDFALSGSNTCETVGSLAAGANCTISVTFTPSAQGAVTGQVDITDNAPGSPQSISLSGTGTAPGVSLTPSALNLGSEDIGSTSTAQSATLSNTGTGPLTINSIGFTGTNPLDFGQTNSCPINPQQLASGNSCIISVTFSPTAKGARSATLSVSDTGPGSPQKVAVSGTGTQPVVVFTPSTGVSFPSTIVGTSSGTRPLSITNTGDGPLDISSITFTGTNAGDFSETDSCVGAANAVAPQKSCTINVNFVPTASGTRSASLVVADNAASPKQQVAVSGQATDFQLVASGGVTTATISAGQTAIFPLEVDPKNSGFTGTVSFGCTNPPPKGSCTVSPPSIQITGSTPVSFSVSVGTMSNALLIPRGPRTSPWPHAPRIPLVFWLPLVLLGLIYLRWASGRKKRLVPRFILAFAVLLLASCGGGGGTPGGNGTPPGTYTVTATGSVGSGAARTLNLTVTVQ